MKKKQSNPNPILVKKEEKKKEDIKPKENLKLKEEKIILNERYKQCDLSFKEKDQSYVNLQESENRYEAEIFEKVSLNSSPISLPKNEFKNIEKNNKGYANLYKKKNEDPIQDNTKIIEISKEEQQPISLDGKIKIMNKENLKKLLIDE